MGTGTVTITVDPRHPVNVIVPARALGAGVDGHGPGDIAAIYTPANLSAMRAVGFHGLTYRLRTELGIEAWHWNRRGQWSDPERAEGYWTSDDHADAPIEVSYGYRLPRRGNSVDQAGNDGYSRLDDGDTATFWKSNPYLDRRFTGEDEPRHPQWVIIDLGARQPLSAIRIRWGAPFATRYLVQYWRGDDPVDIDERPDGDWTTFPRGTVSTATGGDTTLALAASPVRARFVRILLTRSSRSAAPGARDPRDSVGYAIRELALGAFGPSGRLLDRMRHGTVRATQTLTFVSSTDPWHRASDIDRGVEQPGLDRVFRSGLTDGVPVLVPVPLLYDSPANAAAELRFLRWRGYAVERVELGEEPDGQYATPEDAAALYAQVADSVRPVAPAVVLGGPSAQSLGLDPMMAWSGLPGRPGGWDELTWLGRFWRELHERGRGDRLGFLSFEWYPFDDTCAPTAPQLATAPALLDSALARLEHDGVPRSIPRMMSEYGYSAFAGEAQVSLAGALLNADIVGEFVARGGAAAYLYGYEPTTLERRRGCDSWGNNALFLSDDHRRIIHRLATYHGARMLTGDWAAPADSTLEVFAARSDITDRAGQPLVTAYALHQRAGDWAVMLVNKDPGKAWAVRIRIRDARTGALSAIAPGARLAQFSSAQYVWHPAGAHGYPVRSEPPARRVLGRASSEPMVLPPYSLSVVRGRQQAP